jgi:hypothetical protein
MDINMLQGCELDSSQLNQDEDPSQVFENTAMKVWAPL